MHPHRRIYAHIPGTHTQSVQYCAKEGPTQQRGKLRKMKREAEKFEESKVMSVSAESPTATYCDRNLCFIERAKIDQFRKGTADTSRLVILTRYKSTIRALA